MTTQRQRPQKKKKPRRFAPVDLENFASFSDEGENPDWLVGAN